MTKLTPNQRVAKAAIIAAYRTQAPALRLTPEELAANPSKLDFELAWQMRLDGGSSTAAGWP